MECLFCKIINNEIPAYKVYEDDFFFAFLDINPKENGHTLIIPKKHYNDYLEIDNNIADKLFNVAKKLEKEFSAKLDAKGCTFLWNYGITQEIKHFHLHLIPKYESKANLTVEEVYNILKK